MKMRFAVPALAAFLMVPAMWAQTGGASAAAAAGRSGIAITICAPADRAFQHAEADGRYSDASAHGPDHAERRRKGAAAARGRTAAAHVPTEIAGRAG